MPAGSAATCHKCPCARHLENSQSIAQEGLLYHCGISACVCHFCLAIDNLSRSQCCSSLLASLCPHPCCVVQGIWKAAKIANPDYFTDDTPLANIGKIGAVGVEIWTMDDGIYFDNILVANDPQLAEEYREKYWAPKAAKEKVRPIAMRACMKLPDGGQLSLY